MRKELVILVDALEEAAIKHLQETALPSFGYLAALHSLPPPAGFDLGLCAVRKQENGRDVQLQVHVFWRVENPLQSNFVQSCVVVL